MEILNEFDSEFDHIISKLEQEKKKRIEKLKNKYKKKLPIKIGDIIYNVTGIIKVENIEFKIDRERFTRHPTNVIFKGRKYKWVKGGKITKTISKNNTIGTLNPFNIKKIDKNKVI